jgi:hypothetical protein
MLSVNNAPVRTRLTLHGLRANLDTELLRRFGVSGRKRSYQTLSVAARSSRRPFLFCFQLSGRRVAGLPRAARGTVDLAGMHRYSAPRAVQAQKEVGAAEAMAAPLNRHSEVLLSLAYPGSGRVAKVNFSKNNNSISITAQSHKVSYKMEYSDIWT